MNTRKGFRMGALLALALVLHFLLRLGGIVSPSERFYLALPLLWLADFALVGRHRSRRPLASYLPAAGVALLAAWAFCALVLHEQARQIHGRVDWREPIFKVLFISAIFVLYGLWARGLTALFGLIPGARELMEARRGWWLRLLRQGIAIVLFAPGVFTAFNVHRSKIANATDPRRELGLAFESATFHAEDGAALSGWFVPGREAGGARGPEARRTVVVCHGVGANKGNMLGVVPFLHRAGWSVLLFDWRGHGDSTGHTTSFGPREARDLVAAVKYLQGRGQDEIALMAYSMGASATLHAIPELEALRGSPAVRAVIVDSTFASLRPLVQAQAAFLPPGPQRFVVGSIDWWTRLHLGTWLEDVEPSRYIARVSPRPLLVIHGLSDTLIAPGHARANYNAALPPKQLWMVPGAGHCEPFARAPSTYEARVTRFLRKAFAS